MQTFDVIIVGAGIVGLNIAQQLARRSTIKVLVLERGAGVGEGSTGASSAICRCRYSIDEVTTLARDGIHAYRHWKDYLGLALPRADFQNDGVLWMTGGDDGWAEPECTRMGLLGIATEVLDAQETAARFPALSTCTQAPDVETGAEHACDHGGVNLFEPDGGHMDPVSAAQDLVEACTARGVTIRFNAQVESLRITSNRCSGLRLTSAEEFSAGVVVNAAGPWCNALTDLAGVEHRWALTPTRIQVLHRNRPAALPGHIPVTVDMAGGIYFRTQNRGQQLIVSSVREEDEREAVANPDDFNRLTDREFELQKLHALHHRLPALDHHGRVSGYCGLYTVNRNDVHPIVGPTSVEGFWVANGFSGHGFKLAPAIGAMLAKALTNETDDYDSAVPGDFFSIDREPMELASLSVLA